MTLVVEGHPTAFEIHLTFLVGGRQVAVGLDAWEWVFGGGEDHALVATFDGAVPDGWRVIGTVADGPPCVLVDGGEWGGSAGWQSFG